MPEITFLKSTGFYQSVKIINDDNRYIAKNIAPLDPNVFKLKSFAGGAVGYTFSKLNDKIVPTSGVTFSGNASYTQNINKQPLILEIWR